jgi:hypothetical protein
VGSIPTDGLTHFEVNMTLVIVFIVLLVLACIAASFLEDPDDDVVIIEVVDGVDDGLWVEE